jgi:hypothetical protein
MQDLTPRAKMARSSSRHFYARIPSNSGFFYSFNVEVTGAVRLYRAASSGMKGWASPWVSIYMPWRTPEFDCVFELCPNSDCQIH